MTIKRRPIYLNEAEAELVYQCIWVKLGEQYPANEDDGDRAAFRCLLASARAQIVRSLPSLADDRVEGKLP